MKCAIESVTFAILVVLFAECGNGGDDPAVTDGSFDGDVESGLAETAGTERSEGSAGSGQTRDAGVVDAEKVDGNDAGEANEDGGTTDEDAETTQSDSSVVVTTDGGQDTDSKSCAYDCVSESFCSGAGTYRIDDMTCSETDEVCCSLKPECTYSCVTDATCTSEMGEKHDEMVCREETDVCCEVPLSCEYECVPTNYCDTADGLIHDDEQCTDAGDVCCEITPVCTHDCVPQAFCDGASGTVHSKMICEDEGDVCCEPPAATYCDTCVRPVDCAAGQVISGDQCLDDTLVCCNLPICSSADGSCRKPELGCTDEESVTDQYFCPGRFVCCIPSE